MNGVRTNVYVDGFNLYYGALKGRGPGYKWLDLERLARHLLPRNDIGRIRYFTAHVSWRPSDPGLPERQQTYLRALATVPGLTIHPGEFKVTYPRMPLYDPHAPADRAPTMAQVIKTEEKGSDVNLASYLLLDACRADCDVAVVITNDSDLREPIRIVQEELGMAVGVVNPHAAYKRSAVIPATFFRQLRPNVVQKSQFPEIVTDTAGRSIHRPPGW